MEYVDTYGGCSLDDHLTIAVNEKPKKCLNCSYGRLLDVIYGEPAGPVEDDNVILAGCCIDEFSHDWECPECHARFKHMEACR